MKTLKYVPQESGIRVLKILGKRYDVRETNGMKIKGSKAGVGLALTSAGFAGRNFPKYLYVTFGLKKQAYILIAINHKHNNLQKLRGNTQLGMLRCAYVSRGIYWSC